MSIKRITSWQIRNFLPLVDSMFDKIRARYEEVGGRFLFDLSELSYFDSTIVGLILRSVSLTGTQKNSLIASGAQTKDILSLLGLDRLVDIYDSEEEWAADGGA